MGASRFPLTPWKTQLFEAENMFQRRSLQFWKKITVFKQSFFLTSCTIAVRSDKGIPTDEINMFEFELFSTINQTINLTYSFLDRKRSLLCISCCVFTVAFYKMLSILPQHRLLSEHYPANHRSIQISLLFESIINSVVRLPRSPRHFRKPRHIPNLERDWLKRPGNEIDSRRKIRILERTFCLVIPD